MIVLLYFIYVCIMLVSSYFDKSFFNQSHFFYLIISTLIIVSNKKGSLFLKKSGKRLYFIYALIAVFLAFIVFFINHKPGFIGFYDTFYNLHLIDILKVCIFYPIMEELIFRFFWLNKLNEKYSILVSILISSLGFSISHFFSDIGLIYPFLFGILMSCLYLKFKNIYLCIIFHIFYNSSILFANTFFC